MNKEYSDILDKIRKVQALAENGEAGEKESAEMHLRMLMEKYRITEDDLDTDREEVFYYHAEGHDWEMLFLQVSIISGVKKLLIIGTNDYSKRIKNFKKIAKDRPRGTNVSMVCTRAQFVEVTTKYEILQKSFDAHYDAFTYAFLWKNNLLAKSDGTEHELTEEERVMLQRACGMYNGIDKSDRQITNGKLLNPYTIEEI